MIKNIFGTRICLTIQVKISVMWPKKILETYTYDFKSITNQEDVNNQQYIRRVVN